MKQEILMLLAKIRYALGDYQGALDRLEEVSLDNLPLSDISSRKMKLIGESFAIRGWYVENFFVPLSCYFSDALHYSVSERDIGALLLC